MTEDSLVPYDLSLLALQPELSRSVISSPDIIDRKSLMLSVHSNYISCRLYNTISAPLGPQGLDADFLQSQKHEHSSIDDYRMARSLVGRHSARLGMQDARH